MVTVKGVDELLKALKQFPQNIQKNVLKGAVRAGAASLVKEAKANVPADTGNLKKSIGVVEVKSKKPQYVQFKVTPRKGFGLKSDGWYAHMVEFGTLGKRDEPLSSETHRSLKAKEMAEKGFGSPAQPFMRPAYENKGEETITVAKEYLEKRIDKEVEKAKKGIS